VAMMLAVIVATAFDAPRRRSHGIFPDATPFMQAVDLPTFPEKAVICAAWDDSLPLRYTQLVLTKRRDIRIITADPVNWLAVTAEFTDRPVYVARKHPALHGQVLTPFRNVWRLERSTTLDSSP